MRDTVALISVFCFDGMRGWECSVEKVGIEKHFFDCVRIHDLVFDRNSSFSIHRSDCIRIGLINLKSVLFIFVVAFPGSQNCHV